MNGEYMNSVRPKGLRTWVEVDRARMEHNFSLFRGLLAAETRLMAVVKSNAYGHGLVDFAKEMERLGADMLGVDSFTEARRLRGEGIILPILVLGFTLPEDITEAAEKDIALTVSSKEMLDALEGSKEVLSVHIKIDTGMHRQGFLPEEVAHVSLRLSGMSHVHCEGVYTHFANGKNPNFPEDCKRQVERFKNAYEHMKKAGLSPMCHASATSGTLLFPEYHFDMVRVGIGMYGLWPSAETRRVRENAVPLTPILSWKSIISEIKTVHAGERIGYNFTETFRKDTKIAVVPVGYWHGFVRALSGVGNVLVRGKRARVLGRVSMDMICIDVSEIDDVSPLDIVTLLGRDGEEEVAADEHALFTDTINYEVVTRINPKIRRCY